MAVPKVVYSTYEKQLEKEVHEGPIPKHLAIIMDGNRRYAEQILGEEANKGHMMGELKVEEMLDWCLSLNISYVTVFAFSTENFNREQSEIDFLMDLCEASLYKMADTPKVHESKVRIRVLGDHSTLPQRVLDAIDYADEKTSMYTNMTFNVAIAYGGRQEIITAVKNIAQKVKDGEIDIDDISEELFSDHLYTSDIPDPDLILRTSGEVRMSNFLLWQLAYSELYFTDVYWPGFRHIDFLRAIRSYQQRVRRYGS
ncbi:MAG: polyprenyl diphosphate synthase [Candidatus Methanomethylophilaceae archaeon]|nr:polyprenyl diphosphate synthase [Candidatus Methanomethylophilaceae archaeon]MDD3378376.1 polyprenyl diphosphate synthase [Candidatus Methanomethylophilaceae archaeon]MDY0223876.1 polyprenyl diphosphate synthase [Candidatus Methanomethylophilaceae archaeon]